jgi:hypothetical protein
VDAGPAGELRQDHTLGLHRIAGDDIDLEPVAGRHDNRLMQSPVRHQRSGEIPQVRFGDCQAFA